MLNLKPSIKVMNQAQIDQVQKNSLQILSGTGIIVEDKDARLVFEKAIGETSKDDRIRLPDELIRRAISSAPSEIQIYDRRGNPCFELKGDSTQETVFGTGVTNLHYHDPFSKKIIPFHRKHMADAAALTNSLEDYDFISTPGVIQDIPPETADIYSVLEMQANTVKPIVMLISHKDSFSPALDMCEHLFGNLDQKPFLMPYVNPITPLVLNSETTRKMKISIKRGLPVIFSNYGMSGATCPITPAGTLALLNAELLAGLVYSQLIKEGAPIVLGSLPAAFDMKNAGSYYSPKTLLLNLACAEILTSYGIPHCGTSGSGNGWEADLLAGTTLCINHFTSCLGAAGMVPFVGGNFDSLVFSPELVVYANDFIHQSRNFASGFSLADEEVGLDDISSIGPGGNFLLSGLTTKHFKESQFDSLIWPFLSLEKWQSKGEPEAGSVLNEKTCELIKNPLIPDDKKDIIASGEEFIKQL
ncbi:trimethylamine methyltransferase family protein [Desulfobacterales bacterium HSG17]|nr:trimethylamine methyltransferase family protein [Desulfobacterales bacterium HSG17]